MGFGSEFWQKHWLHGLMRGLPRAEDTVESIHKILTENGITEGKILDICCGIGRLSIWLAKKGFEVVGLDLASLYIEEALRKVSEFGVESNVKFLVGDMRNIDEIVGSESPFDCVINFWNAIGFYGDKVDEMIFTKVRRMTKKGGILIIGETDHTGQLMFRLNKRRFFENDNYLILNDASMDYITNMFTATFRYYTKEGDILKYFDTFDYQVRVYSVSELSSLLERAGWKVIGAYEDLQTLEPFTGNAIFKGNTSMNLVAKAV